MYTIRNVTSAQREDGQLRRTAILSINGTKLYPGREMISSTLTSDILGELQRQNVSVVENTASGTNPVFFNTLSVKKERHVQVNYTADGKVSSLKTVFVLVDDEKKEEEAPEAPSPAITPVIPAPPVVLEGNGLPAEETNPGTVEETGPGTWDEPNGPPKVEETGPGTVEETGPGTWDEPNGPPKVEETGPGTVEETGPGPVVLEGNGLPAEETGPGTVEEPNGPPKLEETNPGTVEEPGDENEDDELRSYNFSAKEAITFLGTLTTREEVLSFTTGEERSTVLKARDARLDEIGE